MKTYGRMDARLPALLTSENGWRWREGGHLLVSWYRVELIFSALKMEAICSSETSVDTQRTTRFYIPEDGTLHNHRFENLKSHICYMLMMIPRRVVEKYIYRSPGILHQSLHNMVNLTDLFPTTHILLSITLPVVSNLLTNRFIADQLGALLHSNLTRNTGWIVITVAKT
jgi:hypothetical protein